MHTECVEKKLPMNDILVSGPSMINKMGFRKKQNEKFTNSIIQKSNILRNQSFKAQNGFKKANTLKQKTLPPIEKKESNNKL